MILFFYISVVLLFGVPFTDGRLGKKLKPHDSILNRLQTRDREEYSKLDLTGMLSDNSDPFSSFDLNIPTESNLKLLNPNKPSNNTVPINQPRPGIGVSFTTATGVNNKAAENVFSPGFKSEGAKPVNKIDIDLDKKEGKKNNLKTTEKKDTVKTLTAKKILFQVKPVLPANELDDTETDIIYYID